MLLGKTKNTLLPVELSLKMANRHGLIAGATGTGKTVTLQKLAEEFSRAGVSVFAADIKGDLSGIAKAGLLTGKIKDRVELIQLGELTALGNPVVLWDLFGKSGVPIRTTVSEVGPVLLSRILELNETQDQVLQLIFKVADDEGLLLLDLKDLRELLAWVSDNLPRLKTDYGNMAPATLGAIQRAVLNLSERGGESLFGEPELELDHLLQRDFSGHGVINLLDATTLLTDSTLYSSFLLWLLTELFEELPEVGDLEAPKLVFFFDEAHLLFRDTPSSLVSRIEQLVKLIRSKGVGVYFVTQSPSDIPDPVLAQLGNRIQHALRAYTPKEQKAIKAAAESFRVNPEFNTAEVLTELSVGEALVSCLDDKGTPQIVARTLIAPPASRIGPLSEEEREDLVKRSTLYSLYANALDRDSAYEELKRRKSAQPVEQKKSPGRPRQSVAEAMLKSMARSIGSQLGRSIMRGIFGTMTRRR